MNKHFDFLTADTIWQHDVNIRRFFFLKRTKSYWSSVRCQNNWSILPLSLKADPAVNICCLSLQIEPDLCCDFSYRWVSVNMVCSCFTELKAFIVSTNSSSSTYWKRTQHMASGGVNNTTHSQRSSRHMQLIRPQSIRETRTPLNATFPHMYERCSQTVLGIIQHETRRLTSPESCPSGFSQLPSSIMRDFLSISWLTLRCRECWE